MRFWDASAITPLIVEEDATREVQNLYRSDPEMVVWTFTELEVLSGLCRRFREEKLTAKSFESAVERLTISRQGWHEVKKLESVHRRARRLLRSHPLRAADALQLAAALVAFREEIEGVEFLTYDALLRAAAQAEGFLAPV